MDFSSFIPNDLSSLLLVLLGLAGAFGFMMRQVVQWYLSEKAGKVLSPTIYWQISLLASFIFILYGLGRRDIAIIFGQLISYYIYARNLHLKASWSDLPLLLRIIILITPAVALYGIELIEPGIIRTTISWAGDNTRLALFGTFGFLIMATRFIYQWAISERKKESSLPLGFWLLSMLGAGTLFVYGILRQDIVLIASNSINVFLYIRNVMILNKEKES